MKKFKRITPVTGQNYNEFLDGLVAIPNYPDVIFANIYGNSYSLVDHYDRGEGSEDKKWWVRGRDGAYHLFKELVAIHSADPREVEKGFPPLPNQNMLFVGKDAPGLDMEEPWILKARLGDPEWTERHSTGPGPVGYAIDMTYSAARRFALTRFESSVLSVYPTPPSDIEPELIPDVTLGDLWEVPEGDITRRVYHLVAWAEWVGRTLREQFDELPDWAFSIVNTYKLVVELDEESTVFYQLWAWKPQDRNENLWKWSAITQYDPSYAANAQAESLAEAILLLCDWQNLTEGRDAWLDVVDAVKNVTEFPIHPDY